MIALQSVLLPRTARHVSCRVAAQRAAHAEAVPPLSRTGRLLHLLEGRACYSAKSANPLRQGYAGREAAFATKHEPSRPKRAAAAAFLPSIFSLISSEFAFSSGAYMAKARVGSALNLPGISARMRYATLWLPRARARAKKPRP